jgi:cation diffusion facilitator CzcD-associated flavoprotein CzcO
VTDAIVIGAGTAGLAAAATLRRSGVDVMVLERTDQVGASWRTRYDDLRLNTPGWMSTQPGFRARRRRYGEFPSRDSWIRYLEDYAAHHRLDIRFGTQVQRLEAMNGEWRLEAGRDDLCARLVVVATGFDHDPYIPDWPGRDGFAGDLIHSAAYRNPEPFRGRDVLVVGPGTTGSEVAALLSRGGAGRVRVASRTPPNLSLRKVLGTPVNIPGIAFKHLPARVGDHVGRMSQRMLFGNLDRYGLPRSPNGVETTIRRFHQGPAMDSGFVSRLKCGAIEIVAAVNGFDGQSVLLADGERIQPEVVIAATGYRRGLEALVGHLGVLDAEGIPLVKGGKQHSSAPGLFFIGYEGDLSGQLRIMRFEARAIGRAVRHQPAVRSLLSH